MAFPYTFNAQFETADNSEFDSETDGNGVLDFLHYRQLAGHGAIREVPYQGAYAMHIDLTGADTTQYVQEDDSFDMALNAENYLRFYFFARGLTMAASDRFSIFALQSAGPVDEAVIDIRNNAGTLEILASETGAAATVRAAPLVQGVWHCLELFVVLDAGVGNDGQLTFWLDGAPVSTAITSLDQAAIIQARFGAMGVDAGTTAGHLLFDQIVFDDERIGELPRFPMQQLLTKTGHAFLGTGQLYDVYLEDGGSADTTLVLYDSDIRDTLRPQVIPPLDATKATNNRIDDFTSAGFFNQGVYAVLGGTNPRAWVTVRHANALSLGGVRHVAALHR